MTSGQWLLDYFWNSTELLTGFNKVGGVLMALTGAALVVPHGVRTLRRWAVGRVRRFFRRVGTAVRSLRDLFFPPKGRHINVELSSAGSMASVGTPTITVGDSWPEAESADARIQWLYMRLGQVEMSLRDNVANLEAADSKLRADLQSLRAELLEMITAIQAKLADNDARAVQIDAIGFLPISAGIILTGVPDELAKWGTAGWLIWMFFALITIASVKYSKDSGIWSEPLPQRRIEPVT